MHRHMEPGRRRRAGLWIVLCLASGCAGRAGKIENYSLRFMAKDGEDCYAAKRGQDKLRRDGELAQLARMRAFREGMTPDELKRVLGKPTFVWNDVPDSVKESGDFDLRYVYQLGVGLSARAEFVGGLLRRMYRHDEWTDDPEGRRIPIRLVR
jgi:hypothetical protein